MAPRVTKTSKPPGSNVSAETFTEFYGEYSTLLSGLEAAQTEIRLFGKRAKSAGIKVADLKAMRKEQRMDREELVSQHRARENYRRYLGLPLGTQTSLDLAQAADPADPKEQQRTLAAVMGDAAARGLAAGKAGHSRDANPYEQGTQIWQAFDLNWVAGQRLIAEGLGNGNGAAPARRGRTGRGRSSEDGDPPLAA